jgi:hypothetical protein
MCQNCRPKLRLIDEKIRQVLKVKKDTQIYIIKYKERIPQIYIRIEHINIIT